MKKVIAYLGLGLMLLLGLNPAGAADTGSIPQEAELRARIEQRWQALENYDFAKAYEFATPLYRSVFSPALYEKKYARQLSWHLTGIKTLNYHSLNSKANVIVQVEVGSNSSLTAAPKEIEEIEEIWLYVDNRWWYNEGV